jgi:hypothetical protein
MPSKVLDDKKAMKRFSAMSSTSVVWMKLKLLNMLAIVWAHNSHEEEKKIKIYGDLEQQKREGETKTEKCSA